MEKSNQQVLDSAILSIEKKHGKGSIMLGNTRMDVPVICSTGSLKLDAAIGVGGIPRGRTIEIFGSEASGKTSTLLSIIAEAQKVNETCAFVDAEESLDPVWATNLGVDMNKLLLSQPNSGEEALDIVQTLVESGVVGIIGVDSVAALVPKAELDGEIGDSHMGLQARMMSQAMRILTPKIAKSNCTVIFLNQLRSKIGVAFGNPEVVSGGNALKFYASIRLDVRRPIGDSTVTDEDGMTVAGVNIKIVKNKVAPPFKKVQLELETGVNGCYGYNQFKEVLDLGVQYNIIKKAGVWYSYNEERIGQGKENASNFLKKTSNMYNEIKDKVFEIVYKENKPIIGSFKDVTNKIQEEERVEPKKRKKKEDEGNFEEVAIGETSESENKN